MAAADVLTDLEDGMYHVQHNGVYAAFLVVDGKIPMSMCAPVLRRNIQAWTSMATKVED